MFPKEKKYFENETNRKQFQIKDNQIWYFDFSNSVTDFNDLTVKPVRYVCKTRDSSIVSFIVSFKLVLIKEESNEIQKPAQGSIAADGAKIFLNAFGFFFLFIVNCYEKKL
ncbi:hypothetical protein RhiirA5_476049 [Rhizophagus irregularis]|uniref:Domain of unknown function at the cortex 1 domain-containing protein n=1 Tax=Rhizophagus irregularis TaxID=588596 RepID=A0A2N0QB75_9GLOM|nr:hypothetical protein RhiirA5_476049 [Rhizophagus irregularis]